MARFHYTAKDARGRTKRGTIEAASEKSVQQLLKEKNLYPITIREKKESEHRKKLSSKLLAEFNRELSNLLGSGVSLVRALDIISREEGIPDYARGVYQAVLVEVKKGIALSEAMEACGCFPDLMLGMIRSGEGSGNLDQVTGRLAVHYTKDDRLSGQVKSAMVYPAILLFLCIAVIILMVTYVLPQFSELFDALDELPLATRILMAISDFVIGYWYVLILILFIAAIAIRVLRSIPAVRQTVDSWKVHLPIVGKLNQVIYTARFARTLSSLYSSGMPIVSALKTAGDTIGNRYVEVQFDAVAVQVRSGIPLSQALMEVDGLQKKLASTIFIGEESGRLDSMLDSIAEAMEADAEEATKRLVTLLEPVMIILMALIVVFIIAAVMLPIYQSYGAIEKIS